ncbi:MAG: carboxypeptidase-like regulatory domain-containing protein [Butyricimonas faecihominis]
MKNETVKTCWIRYSKVRSTRTGFPGTDYRGKASGNEKAYAKVVIEGTVMERDSMPIIGATIVLQGTTTGVATDVNGKFRLVVPMDDGLYRGFFLGMKKQVHKVLGLPTPKPMQIVCCRKQWAWTR